MSRKPVNPDVVHRFSAARVTRDGKRLVPWDWAKPYNPKVEYSSMWEKPCRYCGGSEGNPIHLLPVSL